MGKPSKKYYCQYHPDTELDDAMECSKCDEELVGYGKFAGGGYSEKDLTNDVKNLLKRSGVGHF
jgi:hypothetical protein